MSHRTKRNRREKGPVPAAKKAPFPGGKTLLFVAVAAIVIVLAITWLPSYVSPGARLAASADPGHGQQLYIQYCVSCHGADGRGEFNWQYRGRAAPALDSSGHAWHHEDAQLISMILDKPLPDSSMPAWRGVISMKDTIDLIAYIKTLWTPYIRENCQGARHMSCMSHR